MSGCYHLGFVGFIQTSRVLFLDLRFAMRTIGLVFHAGAGDITSRSSSSKLQIIPRKCRRSDFPALASAAQFADIERGGVQAVWRGPYDARTEFLRHHPVLLALFKHNTRHFLYHFHSEDLVHQKIRLVSRQIKQDAYVQCSSCQRFYLNHCIN